MSRAQGKNLHNKLGFTLIELSIVLVIIGLLIGGILVAQSLIGSTNIQAFIRQVAQYDAAVGLFNDKFKAMPGDNTIFGSTGVVVNGSINDDAAGGASISEFTGEMPRFWSDLSESGLKSEEGARFTGTGGAIVLGSNVPTAAAGDDCGIVAYGANSINFYNVANYLASDADETANAGCITPIDVFSIDTKMDDGISDSGDVEASIGVTLNASNNTGGVSDYVHTASACVGPAITVGDPNDPGEYDVEEDAALECQIRIRIGSATGLLE